MGEGNGGDNGGRGERISAEAFEAGAAKLREAIKVANDGADRVSISAEVLRKIEAAFLYLSQQAEEAEAQEAEDGGWRDAQQETIRTLIEARDAGPAPSLGPVVHIHGGTVTINLGESLGFDLGEALGSKVDDPAAVAAEACRRIGRGSEGQIQ